MKMSDVFSPPVEPHDGFDEYLVTGTKEINLLGDQAIAAAHAINCHDELVKALESALSEIEYSVCYHESTHRGGVIWTICDDCGAKWADDEGGFKKPKENKRVTMLRHVLSKARGAK